MCNICGHENGTTRHLLYWQAEWLKRFFTTWWHIVNRKAYWEWCEENCTSYRKKKVPNPIIKKWIHEIDEGLRMDLDEVLKRGDRDV